MTTKNLSMWLITLYILLLLMTYKGLFNMVNHINFKYFSNSCIAETIYIYIYFKLFIDKYYL
jgi:hypothetical protein